MSDDSPRAWGEIRVVGDGTPRIVVWVDYDPLTPDEARSLAQWLTQAAAELDAED